MSRPFSALFYTAQWGKDNIMIISGVISSAVKSSICDGGGSGASSSLAPPGIWMEWAKGWEAAEGYMGHTAMHREELMQKKKLMTGPWITSWL